MTPWVKELQSFSFLTLKRLFQQCGVQRLLVINSCKKISCAKKHTQNRALQYDWFERFYLEKLHWQECKTRRKQHQQKLQQLIKKLSRIYFLAPFHHYKQGWRVCHHFHRIHFCRSLCSQNQLHFLKEQVNNTQQVEYKEH